jgi:hypothetical protein
MKLLHVEIRECRECPYCTVWRRPRGTTVGDGLCDHETYSTVVRRCPDHGIPSWCPLPDAKEEKP